MRIDIVYRDENGHDEFISSFYNLTADPFNVGDEINLTVNNIPLVELDKFIDEEKKQHIIDENNKKRVLFRHKRVKLVSRNIYSELNFIKEDALIIEYFCEFVEE